MDTEELKNKAIVEQCCRVFGAYETAKKVSEDPQKLNHLINFLLDGDVTSTAYLIAKNFLSEEEFGKLADEFKDLESEELTRNRVAGELHLKLTGESILETKKKLRALKRAQIKQERQQEKEEKRQEKAAGKGTEAKEAKPAPTHNKDGVEYLKIEDFGFEHKNFFFVPTGRSFFKVKDHFVEQKVIGFDLEFNGTRLSTVTLASEELVAVFDMISLKKNKDVFAYIKDILLNEKIDKVAHTFRTDAYILEQALGIDPYEIKNVLDLTEIIKNKKNDNRIGLQQMCLQNLDKALNQYYKRQDWEQRPIPKEMIDYAGLNGFIVLKLFLEFDKANPDVGIKYYDYEPQKGNPVRGRATAQTKRNTRTAKKTSNSNRRGPRRKDTDAGRSRKRRGGKDRDEERGGGRRRRNRSENRDRRSRKRNDDGDRKRRAKTRQRRRRRDNRDDRDDRDRDRDRDDRYYDDDRDSYDDEFDRGDRRRNGRGDRRRNDNRGNGKRAGGRVKRGTGTRNGRRGAYRR